MGRKTNHQTLSDFLDTDFSFSRGFDGDGGAGSGSRNAYRTGVEASAEGRYAAHKAYITAVDANTVEAEVVLKSEDKAALTLANYHMADFVDRNADEQVIAVAAGIVLGFIVRSCADLAVVVIEVRVAVRAVPVCKISVCLFGRFNSGNQVSFTVRVKFEFSAACVTFIPVAGSTALDALLGVVLNLFVFIAADLAVVPVRSLVGLIIGGFLVRAGLDSTAGRAGAGMLGLGGCVFSVSMVDGGVFNLVSADGADVPVLIRAFFGMPLRIGSMRDSL